MSFTSGPAPGEPDPGICAKKEEAAFVAFIYDRVRMNGRDLLRRRGGVPITAIAVLTIAALPAGASAGPQSIRSLELKSFSGDAATAGAVRAGSKRPQLRTGSTAVTLSSGARAAGKVKCPSKTHITGGGYAVAPAFQPAGGLRTIPTSSIPVGSRSWQSSVAAFADPPSSGSLTTFVRCEGRALGALTGLVKGSVTLPPGGLTNVKLQCPKGAHVVSGGFAGDAPSDLNTTTSFRTLILASERTSKRVWTVTGFNNNSGPSGAASELRGFALCELDLKVTRVSEASTTLAVASDARVSAEPRCNGNKHSVSGGFSVSHGNSAAFVPIDESYPVGKKGWHLGAYEQTGTALPAGTTLTATVYCKRN